MPSCHSQSLEHPGFCRAAAFGCRGSISPRCRAPIFCQGYFIQPGLEKNLILLNCPFHGFLCKAMPGLARGMCPVTRPKGCNPISWVLEQRDGTGVLWELLQRFGPNPALLPRAMWATGQRTGPSFIFLVELALMLSHFPAHWGPCWTARGWQGRCAHSAKGGCAGSAKCPEQALVHGASEEGYNQQFASIMPPPQTFKLCPELYWEPSIGYSNRSLFQGLTLQPAHRTDASTETAKTRTSNHCPDGNYFYFF